MDAASAKTHCTNALNNLRASQCYRHAKQTSKSFSTTHVGKCETALLACSSAITANSSATALTNANTALNELILSTCYTSLVGRSDYSTTYIGKCEVEIKATISAINVQDPTPTPTPAGYYSYLDFDARVPTILGGTVEPQWNITTNFANRTPTHGAQVSVTRVADPLGIEGNVCRVRNGYDSTLTTDYTSNALQLGSLWVGANYAHAGYQDGAQVEAEETWYYIRHMYPVGSVFCGGEANMAIEWHTDPNTQSLGGNSTVFMAYGGSLVSTGTTAPKWQLRIASGIPGGSTGTYTYFPGGYTNSTTPGHGAGGHTQLSNYAPGVWHDHIFHFVWSKNPTIGLVEWMVDGVLIASQHMSTLYDNPNLAFGQAYNTFAGAQNYRYNVDGDSNPYFSKVAIGPTNASVTV